MKARLATLILPLVLAPCAPALAQPPMAGTFQTEPLPNMPTTNKDLPPEPEARADALRMAGRCDAAIPIYSALASQGAGYELAEFNLGRCMYEIAGRQDAQAAAATRQQAAQWIIKAANSGLPNAQNALVTSYLDGLGVAADPVEAGKWSLLYHSNGSRRLYGLPDVAPALKARLDSVLNDAAWAKAQARADSWNPTVAAGSADR